MGTGTEIRKAGRVRPGDEGTEAVLKAIGALSTKQQEMEKAFAELRKPAYGDGRDPGTVFATARDPKGEGRWGFKSFSHYLREVTQSKVAGRPTEFMQKAFGAEYVQKAAQGMGELIGSDGGYLVPPTFSNTIFERVYENDLLSRTDQYTVAGNSMVFPRNAESSRATGSRYGGVQSYWRQEGSSATLSKPTFGRLQLTLHKLICLAAVTSELIEDASTSIEQYLTRVFADEITFMVGDAIVNGTGAGQPMGLLNAPCKISVAKETGQTAATIEHANIVKMWARLWAGNRSKAVWLINQDTTHQLYSMYLPTGSTGVAAFMPPGGLSGKPYATILGAPVIETEFNATLGTEGDIILVDLSHYVTINKGGPDTQSSMHLYFDTDEQAFRVTYRIDGQPWWHSALTPYKGGSNTQSMCVTLATRS